MNTLRDPASDRDELQEIRAGVTCAVVLEQEGFLLDKKESTRNSPKYRSTDGRTVIINHQGRGWWDPHDAYARGDVFKLVQHLNPGLTLGHVRQRLRPMIGRAPTEMPLQHTTQRERPDVPVAEQWAKRRTVRPGSPVWRYLTEIRALPDNIIQAAIRQDVLREGYFGTALFSHRDDNGVLTNFEMRGPTYRGCPRGGDKTLFRLRAAETTINRLVVTEAAIDALSFASLDHMRPGTLYLSTAGGIGPRAVTALEALLRDLATVPNGKLVIGTDLGEGGDRFAAVLATMADTAGVWSGRILPFDGAKDWNAVLVQRAQLRAARAEGAPS
ncbi:DUF3991 domain-containing protein (plasmid) [Lichenicola cladoniae]|uniref:DUF3991 domain-containing protein n=1 Tax=Lichenicola cladoniae TaxID=1484109 RepID=A0A6M8HXQ1_9PROT|nr:DUF3991 and TOPRIM domain-containing protein [Lichenicola cladoniae]NPD70271.1 DUF3991 domain-containing protein [Acetobacteraceae bacterium]QKE93329.1 DUF3991 domain-containing protein [Lichenicola cladoniae]